MSFKQSDEEFGVRPFEMKQWKDLAPKQDPHKRRYESDPEALAQQLREAFTVPKRKPDIIDKVTDEAIRTSLMSPAEKAAGKREAELAQWGYVEVNGKVTKKEQAVELVREGEVELADVFGLKPADVTQFEGESDDERYWQRIEREVADENRQQAADYADTSEDEWVYED